MCTKGSLLTTRPTISKNFTPPKKLAFYWIQPQAAIAFAPTVIIATAAEKRFHLRITSWQWNPTSTVECWMKFQTVRVCPVGFSSAGITRMLDIPASWWQWGLLSLCSYYFSLLLFTSEIRVCYLRPNVIPPLSSYMFSSSSRCVLSIIELVYVIICYITEYRQVSWSLSYRMTINSHEGRSETWNPRIFLWTNK